MFCTKEQAYRIIDTLRKGIPPDGFVRDFTAGRENEITSLKQHLHNENLSALLLNANYGAGKTHLIKFIREEALEQNYAVSVVTLDAKNGIRFNRMDQIFGAICRNLEIPIDVKENDTSKGIRSFLNLVRRKIQAEKIVNIAEKRDRTYINDNSFWKKLSDNGKWNYTESLNSNAIYVALRAWYFANDRLSDTIEDWLLYSEKWTAKRKELYKSLVGQLIKYFRDSRPEWKFYQDEVFSFSKNGYTQSWQALRDLNELSLAVGLNGLIILFDEFEDILTNITRIDYQEQCFWNLFEFCSEKYFCGKTFYAVTPEFVNKCTERLLIKGKYDFDFERFDALSQFKMSPLDNSSLIEIGKKIVEVHGLANNWDTSSYKNNKHIATWLKETDIKKDLIIRDVFLMKIFFSGVNKLDENIKLLETFKNDCNNNLDSLKSIDNYIFPIYYWFNRFFLYLILWKTRIKSIINFIL
jgi:Cdc6-like AAA superfamily ATPase